MKDVFIIDGKRTCIGKMFGALKGFSAPQLAGVVLKNLAAGYSLKEKDFDFAFIGQAVKAGQGQNPARQALHYAGLGFGIYYSTIDWHYPGSVNREKPGQFSVNETIPDAHHQYSIAASAEKGRHPRYLHTIYSCLR